MKRRHPPELPIHTIAVRSIKGAVVYSKDLDGQLKSIPIGAWSRVPVSSDIMAAIRNGDLEKQPGSEQTTTAPAAAAQTVRIPPAPMQAGILPDLTVTIWKGAAEKQEEVAAVPEPPTNDPTMAAPPADPPAVEKARKIATPDQVVDAIKAMIPLVDSKYTVIAAARAVGPQFGYNKDGETLARLYRGRHRKIRKQMETARRLSAR